MGRHASGNNTFALLVAAVADTIRNKFNDNINMGFPADQDVCWCLQNMKQMMIISKDRDIISSWDIITLPRSLSSSSSSVTTRSYLSHSLLCEGIFLIAGCRPQCRAILGILRWIITRLIKRFNRYPS